MPAVSLRLGLGCLASGQELQLPARTPGVSRASYTKLQPVRSHEALGNANINLHKPR